HVHGPAIRHTPQVAARSRILQRRSDCQTARYGNSVSWLSRNMRLAWTACCSMLLVLLTSHVVYAQYTGNITGIVEDPSGAAIANASVEAINLATRVSATTMSDASGSFRFLSLAPGSYKLTAEAAGFRKREASVLLQTNQTLNVPLTLEVGAVSEQVTVSAESPLVNTAETRNQLTLQTDSLSSLPLAGRSYISLVTIAPGVS